MTRPWSALVLILVVAQPALAWRSERIHELLCERLAYQLRSADPATRRSAADSVARMGPAAASTIPALIKALVSDTDADVRAAVAKGLGSMGAQARSAVPSLLRVAKDDRQPPVRVAAIEALARVASSQGLLAIQRALREDPEARVRIAAAVALAGLGPSAALAQSGLEAAMIKDVDAAVRAAAALALTGLGEPALGSLLKGLRQGDPETRRVAAKALGRLRSPPPGVLAGLVAATVDGEATVRAAAARSLGDLGPKAGRAVLQLQDLLLKDKQESVREAPATALGNIGARAGPALRALRAAAESDPSQAVREAAQQALNRIRAAG